MSSRIGVVSLANGMKVYYRPGHRVNVSGVGVKAGSIHDPVGKVGLAHITEHATCRLSRKHSDARKIDLMFNAYLGGPDGHINIRTDRTSTFYGHGDLLRRQHMTDVFDVMASFVNPAHRMIEQEGLEIEAAAVHQEYYLNGVDAMTMLLDDLVHATLYEKNPARNRIDCELEDLQKITLNDVRRFLRRYYVPKNAFAIFLGLGKDEAICFANRHFQDWKTTTVPTLDYDHSDDFPRFFRIRSCEVERPGIHQYHGAIAFPTERYDTCDAEAIDVIGRVLAMRLARELREGNRQFHGGTYRTPVYTERTHVHGLIYGSFATASKEFAALAEEVVIREFLRFTTDLIPQDEFDSAIAGLRNEYCDAFWNNPNALQEMIIDAVSNGDEDLDHFHSFRNRLAKVTRRKVRLIAGKYFGENGYARVLIKPA